MNKNTIIAVVIGVLAALLIGMYVGNRLAKNISYLANNKLKVEVDSLTKEVGHLHLVNDTIEILNNKRIDSIKLNNQKVVEKLKIDYESRKETIKNLPIDEQIVFFISKTYRDREYPKKQIVDYDTTVVITQGQLEQANLDFIEKDALYDLKDTLDSQLQVSYDQIDSTKVVVEKKNNEIKRLNDVLTKSGELITDKDNQLLEQEKTNKKKVFRTAIVSGAVGIILGVILTIL